MKRRAIQIVILLVLGAIVNVAVAWGCAVWSMPNFVDSSKMRERMLQPAWLWSAIMPREAERWEWVIIVSWSEAWGLQVSRYSAHGDLKDIRDDFTEACIVDVTCAGWPMLSMAGCMWSYNRHYPFRMVQPIMAFDPEFSHATFRLETIRETRAPHGMRIALPLRPIWPGFAINTIFYAAIVWVMFFVPGKLKRTLRRRRGLCPACAYPVGTSPVCTECGSINGRRQT